MNKEDVIINLNEVSDHLDRVVKLLDESFDNLTVIMAEDKDVWSWGGNEINNFVVRIRGQLNNICKLRKDYSKMLPVLAAIRVARDAAIGYCKGCEHLTDDGECEVEDDTSLYGYCAARPLRKCV